MAITEKQRNNIYNLPTEDLIDILYECIESLGVFSQVEYMKIVGYKHSRTNLNLDMDKGKIKCVKIGGIRLPIINED
jgi:hypothetical protein